LRWQIVLAAILVLWSGAAGLAAQDYQSLAEVLKQESIPFPPPAIPDLNARITSFATLNDATEFVIAYYQADPKSQRLLLPLLVTRFNKVTGQWQHASLNDPKVEVEGGSSDCLGSVLNVQRHNKRYYLTLHWNPSAGCLLILNDDLTVDQTLAGGPAAFFRSGLFLYSGNMVHFAVVHPETLWLYDPGTRTSKQIYPQPEDPLRSAYSARLAKAINDDRCRVNNWGCVPEEFTSAIAFPVAVNDEPESMAFRVSFEPEGFVDPEAEDNGQWDNDTYVYIFQLKPFRWRAFSVYDLKPKFGTDALPELLTPGKLEKVFAMPAPK
jgi:hypothetical protein